MVPDDAHLPQARLPDGTLTSDPRFQTTKAKVYLGKLLFFDPVRTVRIIPEFGGVLATRKTELQFAWVAMGTTAQLNAAIQCDEDHSLHDSKCGSALNGMGRI